jgi:hypothetical protein
MSTKTEVGELQLLPDFIVPMPEYPVPMVGQEPVEATEALNGLRAALKLETNDQIERCYVANRPYPEWGQTGPEGGLVITSVIVEPNGFKKDREIVVNGNNRHEPLGERAITWFGSIATAFDARDRQSFLRGELPPFAVESNIAA